MTALFIYAMLSTVVFALMELVWIPRTRRDFWTKMAFGALAIAGAVTCAKELFGMFR